MIFKKNKTKYQSRIKDAISECLSPLNEFISDKFQLKGKVRLANRWAKRNPKRLFAAFLVSMVCIFTIDVIVTSIIKDTHKSGVPEMFMVRQSFDGMRNIDSNRENMRLLLSYLIEEGQNLVNEIDSISKIEHKTELDSIAIVSALNRLNVITNFISNEEN